MASNSFGNVFKITTWGESHGRAIGVVIDGCPAGLQLTEDDINQALALRAPGRHQATSPRKEPDQAQLLSGVFEGQTTGAPISIMIENRDADSSKYEPIKTLLRPGHANYTYQQKYGVFDYRGGGRASARETACRVAAAAVAEKILQHFDIEVVSYLSEVAGVEASTIDTQQENFKRAVLDSPIFCPDKTTEDKIVTAIELAKAEGDSLGGKINFIVNNVPVGLGEPVYDKLEACLAHAMLSIPASKAFEIGDGVLAAQKKGSASNDHFNAQFKTDTNHAGGTLGGLSNGMPITGAVTFKATSSIKQTQPTVDFSGEAKTFQLPTGSRHDPCVAIRAVPVVNAMCQLVLADHMLMSQSSRLDQLKKVD